MRAQRPNVRRPTRSETEEVKGLVGSQTRERMAAQRKPQSLIDESDHPLVFEWNELSDPELPHDRIRFPRIAAHQVGQGD